MSYKVSSADLSNLIFNEPDTVDSILQNVAIILATRKGTVPLHRDFGLTQEFLDKPINVAKPLVYAEVKEAVEEFEPRVEVVGCSFTADTASPGKLIPIVEVNILES